MPVRDNRERTLIWTPDASRALAALGNAPDAYGQTWHLPVDRQHPTYRQFVAMAAAAFGEKPSYAVAPKWVLSAAGAFNPQAREIRELLPRYANDNIFDDTKFRTGFPDFRITTYQEGLNIIHSEAEGKRPAN